MRVRVETLCGCWKNVDVDGEPREIRLPLAGKTRGSDDALETSTEAPGMRVFKIVGRVHGVLTYRDDA